MVGSCTPVVAGTTDFSGTRDGSVGGRWKAVSAGGMPAAGCGFASGLAFRRAYCWTMPKTAESATQRGHHASQRGRSASRRPSARERELASPPSSANGRRYHSAADLNPTTWWQWVMTHLSVDENGAVRVNGRRVSETRTRQLHRWRHGTAPSLWAADGFVISFDLHVGAYFAWAEAEGLQAWAIAPPWFEAEPLTPEALAEIRRAWPLPAGVTEDLPGAEDG